MEKFLKVIVDDIALQDLPSLHQRCYVFPTKRACLIFKDLLIKSFKDKAFWSPAIFSIEDFVKDYTKQNTADELTLLFEMFHIYKQYEPDLQFDRFLPWGQVLLKDFDEVDKYLVDAKSLYQNILLIKEIETEFELSSEAVEAIRRFRKIINSVDRNKIIEAFIKEWELVGKVYFEFSESLKKKKLSYAGMLYRELAENLDKKQYNSPYAHIYFCGFNALSLSEEKILDQLLQLKKATAYWDVDKLYMEDPKQEAGSFLRRYKNKWAGKNCKWISSDFLSQHKNIRIIGASKWIAQAKAGCEVLSADLKNKGKIDENTAVVLADENLLLPVLYSLPEQIKGVNVTMGYPLKKSAYIEFIDALFDLHITKRGVGEGVYFKTSVLLKLIQNPYFIYHKKDALKLYLSKTHVGFVSFQNFADLLNDKEVMGLFRSVNMPAELLDKLKNYFIAIFDFFRAEKNPVDENSEEGQPKDFSFEKEVLYHLVKHCKAFQDRIAEYKLELDFLTLKKLLKAALQVQKIPFAGEPLFGLQVMGLLETRALDFDKLILLSANEGNIPAGRTLNSYIPHSLRKAYRLPTFEEQDAIYAYHFFRLLQRATDITLIYNTDLEGDNSGEKSRFLLQLEYIHKIQNQKKHTLEEMVFSNVNKDFASKNGTFEISKAGEILQHLQKYNWSSGNSNATFSPTALTTYITCPLQFYFKYVAGLKEQEEYVEELNALEFGKVLHRVLELLYTPFVGKVVEEKLIRNMLAKSTLNAVVEKVLEEQNFVVDSQKVEGKNKLLVKVIEKLAEKVLEEDLKCAPFKIISLEGDDYTCSMDIGGVKVKLGGTIDRIDQLLEPTEYVRIIDYKTGKTEFKSKRKSDKQSLDEYFAEYFSESKFKAPFQAYYYAYLYKKKAQQEQNLKPGILGLKEVNKGVQFMNKMPYFDGEAFSSFESELRSLISEIFNPEIPFTPTEDKKKCNMCSYKEICS